MKSRGWTKVPNALIDDPDLGPYDMAVLIVLARHGGRSSRGIYPGYRRIARLAGCSQSGVRSALRRLERKGWLRREARSGRSSSYDLIHPCFQETGSLSPGMRVRARTLSPGKDEQDSKREQYRKNKGPASTRSILKDPEFNWIQDAEVERKRWKEAGALSRTAVPQHDRKTGHRDPVEDSR